MTTEEIMKLADEYVQFYLEGYLTAESDLHTPIREKLLAAVEELAKQQPASNEVTNTHGEPVSDGWQLRMVYFQDGEPTMHKAVDDTQRRLKAKQVPLTDREVELVDGMIEVQLSHAERCDHIANRRIAEKQKEWDMERVALLRKLKAAHGIGVTNG